MQRPFVWGNPKVRDLIDSMYRGYPVGELMFWENRDDEHSRSIGADSKTQQATLQIVDGQQRLTSLYAVVKGLEVWREDYTRERIRIAFNPFTERFDVPTAIIENSPEWISDILPIFENPINARKIYIGRLEKSGRQIDDETSTNIELALNQMYGLLQYAFQVVQIREIVPREAVADIFVRINSEGASLSSADFILTWLSVFWEEGRKQIEDFARDSRFHPSVISHMTGEKVTWTPANPYLFLTASQITRMVVAYGMRRGRLQDAYNYLRGRDPRTREINPEQRDIELAKLKLGQEQVLRPIHWDEFLKVIHRAGLRTSEMITSRNTVLYSYVIWLIGRTDFKVPIDELRELMARWLFIAQLTGRYTTSPETQIQNDLSRIGEANTENPQQFTEMLAEIMEAAAPPDWWSVTLPENLITSSTGSPAWAAYIAALNILDAEVLLSTMSVSSWVDPARRPIRGVEKHHLFPRNYLREVLGITSDRRTNQVANYALVEWWDNNEISSAAPTEYWPEQLGRKPIDASRLQKQQQWHALPDTWTQMDYDTFLRERRRLIADVIHQGYKRLSDPTYQPVFKAATAGPISTSPSVTLEELFLEGVLPAGTVLSSVDPERYTRGEIIDDGRFQVGEHLYDSLTLAAQEDGSDTDDGWTYWQALLPDGPIRLDILRESQR